MELKPFKCCGCGMASEDAIKPCDCATGVGFRTNDVGKFEHVVFRDPKSFDAAIHVPGLWRCAKCNFVLVQSNLNMGDGTVTARDEAGDRCPNDNKPLWRVSWKEHAADMAERAEAEILRSNETAKALSVAVQHIEHMAAWITKQNAGYSFESLGEDMPAIRALSPAPGKPSKHSTSGEK